MTKVLREQRLKHKDVGALESRMILNHTFAKEFGWTPQHVSSLTPMQIQCELAMIEENHAKQTKIINEIKSKTKPKTRH